MKITREKYYKYKLALIRNMTCRIFPLYIFYNLHNESSYETRTCKNLRILLWIVKLLKIPILKIKNCDDYSEIIIFFSFFFFRRETRYFWCYDNDCYFYLIINMTTISYFYLIINMYKIKIITCNENSYVI